MAQTPTEVVRQFLANTTNPTIVKGLVDEDATYVSLNYDNPDLKKILPWTGTGKGPQAFIDTFTRVSQFWQILAFSLEELNRLAGMRGVTVVRTDRVTISPVDDRTAYVQIDGELGGKLPAEIQYAERAHAAGAGGLGRVDDSGFLLHELLIGGS